MRRRVRRRLIWVMSSSGSACAPSVTHTRRVGAPARLWPVSRPCSSPASPSGELGIVRPGTCSGANATARPRTTSTAATARTAGAFQGSRRSAAISAATKAIQATLITPSAKRAAISVQQQPMQTAAVLDAHPQRPEATRVPVAQEHRRAAAVAQAGVLRRGQLVEPGADDHAAGDVAARVIPGEQAEIQRAQAVEDRVAEQSRGRPGDEVAGHEQRVGAERGCPPAFAPGLLLPRMGHHHRRDRRQHHRGHHRHPDDDEPPEAAEVGSGAGVHAAHAIAGHGPGGAGEHEQQRRRGRPGSWSAARVRAEGSRAPIIALPPRVAHSITDALEARNSSVGVAGRRRYGHP